MQKCFSFSCFSQIVLQIVLHSFQVRPCDYVGVMKSVNYLTTFFCFPFHKCCYCAGVKAVMLEFTCILRFVKLPFHLVLPKVLSMDFCFCYSNCCVFLWEEGDLGRFFKSSFFHNICLNFSQYTFLKL